MKLPEFKTRKQLFDYLHKNHDRIIAVKKAEMKRADALFCPVAIGKDEQLEVIKANAPITEDIEEIKVRVVINTTNLMDSHNDVHIPGIWNKSLKEAKNIMHLQEHEMKFDHIIADGDDLKPYVKTYTWQELGFTYPGTTQALIFDSTVKEERNDFMFEQYYKGRVKNHSVGMVYVKLLMAINDKDYTEEYKTWNKYIDQVANREDAEATGYFFPVLEAKVVEGSAVPAGSNWATPTLDNNLKEPPQGTQDKEPSDVDTQKKEIINILKNFKFN